MAYYGEPPTRPPVNETCIVKTISDSAMGRKQELIVHEI